MLNHVEHLSPLVERALLGGDFNILLDINKIKGWLVCIIRYYQSLLLATSDVSYYVVC